VLAVVCFVLAAALLLLLACTPARQTLLLLLLLAPQQLCWVVAAAHLPSLLQFNGLYLFHNAFTILALLLVLGCGSTALGAKSQ
jgi:hypothetical protein